MSNKKQEKQDEEELYKSCLTPKEADYKAFAKPGGILGFGISVATNANPPSDEKENKKFMEPISAISQQFWSQNEDEKISTKDVLGKFIEAYGCEPVKNHIGTAKPKRDKEQKEEEWKNKWGID